MINSTLEYLYQLHNRGIKLGLDNIRSILSECENPHEEFKSIHLACLLYTSDAADDS